MSFLKKFFIFVISFLSFTGAVFANNENSHEDTKNPTEIQKTINNYILEVFKFQGNKILADLDTNLEKVAPTKEAKIEAYNSIQKTLKLKKEATEKDTKLSKNNKTILIKYLDYMIKEIENKKKDLK